MFVIRFPTVLLEMMAQLASKVVVTIQKCTDRLQFTLFKCLLFVYIKMNIYFYELLCNVCVVSTQQSSPHLRQSWFRSFRSSTLGCCLWSDQ